MVDETLEVRRRLAAGCRMFAMLGYEAGGTGHLTARDPRRSDHFWINPLGVPFARVTASSLVLVGPGADVSRANPSGVAIVSRLLEARPDVVGVAHAHTIHGVAVAALGSPIEPISQDACAFYEDHAVLDEYHGVVGEAESAAIADALGRAKALIMRRHGLLTVGASIGSAVWWLIALERACRVQLLVAAAGGTHAIQPDVARRAYEQVGVQEAADFSFELMYDLVAGSRPELLDR